MTLKNHEKFEEELTCHFKIDIRNFTNFDSGTGKSKKKPTLMGCFWPKYIMLEVRKYRGVMFDAMQDWYKVWREADLYFQKWHEEFGKFSPEHLQRSKNCDFYWVFLSKVQNVWASNLQGSQVSWQWRMMQNLRRNWLVSSKLTWGIWPNLTQALENVKNLHFNCLL